MNSKGQFGRTRNTAQLPVPLLNQTTFICRPTAESANEDLPENTSLLRCEAFKSVAAPTHCGDTVRLDERHSTQHGPHARHQIQVIRMSQLSRVLVIKARSRQWSDRQGVIIASQVSGRDSSHYSPSRQVPRNASRQPPGGAQSHLLQTMH